MFNFVFGRSLCIQWNKNFYLIKGGPPNEKRQLEKGIRTFSVLILEFEIGANWFSNLNSFLSKIWVRYLEMQPNLKILLEFFRKWPLQAIAAKLESAGTKSFLLEDDQESRRWNRICQISILTLWPVTLAQITWLCYIWIARWLKFFPQRYLFGLISLIFKGKRAVKVGPKNANFG